MLPYFLSAAGQDPPPKRIAPESRVAASCVRRTRGVEPPPKRTRRESITFLLGLRTICFLLVIKMLLGWSAKLRTCRAPVMRRQENFRTRGGGFIKPGCVGKNERFDARLRARGARGARSRQRPRAAKRTSARSEI